MPSVRRASPPRFIEPQLATLVREAPAGETWIHELKLDGYRLLCRLDQRQVSLVTRAGHDWTSRFEGLRDAVATLPARSALLDGEAAVLDPRGRTSFQALQRALGRAPPRDRQPVIFLFDLLFLDGRDLRDLPLLERKGLLARLVAAAGANPVIRYSEHVEGRGPAFFREACGAGVEGIVSKQADAPYRSGRSRTWLKIRCSRRQEFVIVGFTDPAGARTGLGALLLGARDQGGALRYTGKVGTGFSDDVLRQLRKRLGPLERPDPPVENPPRKTAIHWVAPQLVAEIAFTEWTDDGRIRHPSFLGLREDKPAEEVRIELEASGAGDNPGSGTGGGRDGAIGGVRLSTPDRIYFPELRLTKLELARYYEAMAGRVLPGMRDRPLTLVRCPEGIAGECFYQKRVGANIPEDMPRVTVSKGRQPYAMVTDIRSLITLVQVGVLEFHVWGSRADRLDRPDIIVFDLDPGPGVTWRKLLQSVTRLRQWLQAVGLVPFPRVTGGKGVHLVIPIQRRHDWKAVKEFAHAVALEMVRQSPGDTTARMAKSRRAGKVFVDYLRNDAEATAIASYSVRARAGAPVALPVSWEELLSSRKPLHLNPREVLRRPNDDPWSGFDAARRRLPS